MNKSDLKLIIILFVVSGVFLLMLVLAENKNDKKAIVYYEDKSILTLPLSQDGNYQVEGYNGIVNIVVKGGKIKVKDENSPLHLCSNQGYISSSYETIVCLPNKITIKIENIEDVLDTVVG